MTWNKKMMHFDRDGTEPIDTKLYFLLEGDFELIEPQQEPEAEGQVTEPLDEDEEGEEDGQSILYDVIMVGPECSVKVWLPNTIGKGYLTPTAILFDKDDVYLGQNINCAQPNAEDGQPQQRTCANSGLRFLEPFALDVEALNTLRGDAHNFRLKFIKIPYFRDNTITIQWGTDATPADYLPMYIDVGGEHREVRRILFTAVEEEDVPEPPQQKIRSYQSITRGYSTRVEQSKPRLQHQRIR